MLTYPHSRAVMELIFTKPKLIENVYVKSHTVVNPDPCTLCDIVFLFLFLPAFLHTGLPRENRHERDSWVPCEVPSLLNPTTRNGWPYHRGLRPLLFSNSGVDSFTSHKNGFSSLSKKTRKSNYLQMSLQRQHFLLSYLKTMSVGPAGV